MASSLVESQQAIAQSVNEVEGFPAIEIEAGVFRLYPKVVISHSEQALAWARYLNLPISRQAIEGELSRSSCPSEFVNRINELANHVCMLNRRYSLKEYLTKYCKGVRYKLAVFSDPSKDMYPEKESTKDLVKKPNEFFEKERQAFLEATSQKIKATSPAKPSKTLKQKLLLLLS